jgi:hypothetical protein
VEVDLAWLAVVWHRIKASHLPIVRGLEMPLDILELHVQAEEPRVRPFMQNAILH